MRVKSFFGIKSITNLIYGLLMIAPFVAILSRVIYVQSNPNAKDSYSGANGYQIQYRYKIKDVENVDDLESGYIFETTVDKTLHTNQRIYTTEITIASNNNTYIIYDKIQNVQIGANYLTLYDVNNNLMSLINYYNNDLTIGVLFNPLTFTNSTYDLSNFTTYTGVNPIENVEISNNGTLDNAFEYSLQEFTKDNDIGVINFFGWFDGLFLNQTNVHNLVYLNFINWYMNYALLVSSSYLLFLALLWFVNYIRRILDKSMNYDFGGF